MDGWLIRDGEKGGGRVYGGGGKGDSLLGTGRWREGVMEVGGDGDYMPIATLSPPELLLH